jgi:OOP family OmpA-OmpF porin
MTSPCRRIRRSTALALFLVLACAALTACGGGTNTTSSRTQTAAGSGGAGSGGHGPTAIATAQSALANSNSPQQYRVSIYDLRRDGPFVVLDFGLTCLTPSTGCDTYDTFSPTSGARGPVVGGSGQDEEEPSGVFLVDPVAAKAYHAVRDAQGQPFTSMFPSASVGVSLTHLEWVRYPAPPASVTSLDVVFPDGGPQFTGVKVSSGSAPSAGGSFTADPPAPFSQPPSSTSTSGLTLPVVDLVQTVGNQAGSDTESSTQADLTLRSDVLFHFDKANLTPAARSIIAAAASEIRSRASGTVRITGYTDSIGSDAVNIPLSLARARAVLAALRPLTPGVAYAAAGDGSADPVAPNTKPDGSDNPAGRALNRRVTIVFAVKAPAKPVPLPQAGAQSAQPASTTGTATFTIPTSSTYQVTAGPMFRDGNLLALRLTIHCVHGGGSPPASTCNAEEDLGGTATVPPQTVMNDPVDFFAVSGFYLEDPATGTIYIPLRDSYANPVTGTIYTGSMPSNTANTVWAYYPLPPASVTSLTLVAPGDTARIANVPVASSPPAG